MAPSEPAAASTASDRLSSRVDALRRLDAPLFVTQSRSLLQRLPRAAGNLWHHTVNRKQLAFDREMVTLVADLVVELRRIDRDLGSAAAVADGAMGRAQASVEAIQAHADTQQRLAGEIHGLHEWLDQVHRNQLTFSDRAAYLDERLGELMLQVRELREGGGAVDLEATESRIVDKERFDRLVRDSPDGPKLNVGCGSITFDDYVNIDARELPGVDVVADVRRLPFEPGTCDEVYASHTIEHFREHQLRTAILPHWVDLLRSGGRVRLLCPDLDGLLSRVGDGRLTLEEFRRYVYGAEDYVGNDHLAAYNADLLGRMLEEQGLVDVRVVATDRLANGCPEIELLATRP